MMDLFISLLILQALMGAFDTIYHHEIKVALPQVITARTELAIHAIRALLYGLVFFGVAWFEWHGIWALVLIVIVLIEVGLTLWDFVIEDRTRLLPQSERVTHTLLAINGGAAFAFLAVELPTWVNHSSAFVLVNYGWQSWFLTIAAIGVFASGIRDGIASWRVQRLDLKLDLDLGSYQRILISGGTGFIGSALIHELLYKHHAITLLTRDPIAASIQFTGKVRMISHTDELSDSEQFDVIINLAGASIVGGRWSKKRRQILLNSRLDVTENLLSFCRRATHPPIKWIQASAIGYYGTNNNDSVNERSPAGNGFAAELCRQWEEKTEELYQLGIDRTILRFGLVFGSSGGSLPMMLMPFRLGLGSIMGSGKQNVAWIHIEDLLRAIALCIRDSDLEGVVNVVAPDCPTHEEFALATGREMIRPVALRIPAKLLQRLLGEMSSLFLHGPRVAPNRLIKAGFNYRFANLRSALMDLV